MADVRESLGGTQQNGPFGGRGGLHATLSVDGPRHIMSLNVEQEPEAPHIEPEPYCRCCDSALL